MPEHSRNGPGHQKDAASSCHQVSEERRRQEGMRPLQAFQRRSWPVRASQGLEDDSRTMAQKVRRIPPPAVEECRIECVLQGVGSRSSRHRPYSSEPGAEDAQEDLPCPWPHQPYVFHRLLSSASSVFFLAHYSAKVCIITSCEIPKQLTCPAPRTSKSF